jgi:hypothetical protein
MAPDAAALIRDGLALDADEGDAAWQDETNRRLDEIRAGAAEPIDAGAHDARLPVSLAE